MISIPQPAIRTAQNDVHPRLEEIVRRHLVHRWHGRPHAPTDAAFAAVAARLDAARGVPLILDSGCGTGASTRLIAAAFPQAIVLGIDRSEARLARVHAGALPHAEGNALWVRAELARFWWLAHEAGWRLERHFLLHPNPWPKASQIQRRWHAHPVFPALLALGGLLELRTNWLVYAREFALAVNQATGQLACVEAVGPQSITTPFERKYRARSDALYCVRTDLSAAGRIGRNAREMVHSGKAVVDEGHELRG